MKSKSLHPALLGLAMTSALVALPLSARAESPAPATPAVASPSNKPAQTLSGKVTAKSDTSLTIGDRTVSLTIATAFTKGGAKIGRGDVKAGDTVNVVTTDDGQVAVSVEVTTSS